MADCVAALMHDVLGFLRFAAQGGDWGAAVTSRLGYAHAEKMIGIHLNLWAQPGVRRAHSRIRPRREKRYLGELAHWTREETGYQWIQGTRPQTLAFALTDSPAGLAAWIVEKFRAWSDCGGDVESAISRDRMLADISLYWFTGRDRVVILALLCEAARCGHPAAWRDHRRSPPVMRNFRAKS